MRLKLTHDFTPLSRVSKRQSSAWLSAASGGPGVASGLAPVASGLTQVAPRLGSMSSWVMRRSRYVIDAGNALPYGSVSV